jgi:hypothetical protein
MGYKKFLIYLIFPVWNKNEKQKYLSEGGGLKAAGALPWQSFHFQVPIIWKFQSLKLLEP